MQPCIRSVNINILMDNCGVLGIPWIPVTGMSRKIRIQNSYAMSNPAKRKPLWLNSNGHPKNMINRGSHLAGSYLLSFFLPKIDAIDIVEDQKEVPRIRAQWIAQKCELLLRSLETPRSRIEQFIWKEVMEG